MSRLAVGWHGVRVQSSVLCLKDPSKHDSPPSNPHLNSLDSTLPIHVPSTPKRRAGELYGGGNILLKARNLVKGLQGVDNVYTQHTPLLAATLAAMRDGSLSTAAYPFMGSTVGASAGEGGPAFSSSFSSSPSSVP